MIDWWMTYAIQRQIRSMMFEMRLQERRHSGVEVSMRRSLLF